MRKNIAAVQSRTGKYDEALINANHAVSLNPYDASNQLNLGKLYEVKGNSRESLQHNLEAIRLQAQTQNYDHPNYEGSSRSRYPIEPTAASSVLRKGAGKP